MSRIKKIASYALLLCLVIGALVLPAHVAGRDAQRLYDGDPALVGELADGTARWVAGTVGENSFTTGSSLFDGEWIFGTYTMASLAFSQISLANPEKAEAFRVVNTQCLRELLSSRVRAFDTLMWLEDALETLPEDRGHVAYLGYMNLALALHEHTYGPSEFSELHRAVTATLKRRLLDSPTGLIETYPGETYPLDNSAALASLALAEKAQHGKLLPDTESLLSHFERYIDRKTGLLIQAVNRSGEAVDAPRGSGTAFASYFLSFADPSLARRLHSALVRELSSAPLGFGLVSEYPRGYWGYGDIDSGPLVLGVSISATGFSLGSARALGDEEHFRRVYRTVDLFGAPHRHSSVREFATGGPLGNAIMLAMLTALPESELK